ncbi:MAG TPA: GntR family transcriptional regulator [Acetobacteraceae bacterium]|nr:GntR family transcriptional regulator [Acetobacteraceae bacterium]
MPVTSGTSTGRSLLSDQAHEAVQGMIVRGELAPGARLSELELQARLGIGRTPLREAMLRLAEQGLVTIVPQSGSFVAPIQLDRVEEAQFVREQLECAMIREVAGRIDAAGARALHSNLAAQRQAERDGNAEAFYALDEALHAAFAEMAGRPGVWRLIQQGKLHMDRVRRLSLPMHNQIPRLIAQHEAVLAALEKHDAEGAEAALRQHLREVFTTIRDLGLDPARTEAAREAGLIGNGRIGKEPPMEKA